jgi:hypothetical protein
MLRGVRIAGATLLLNASGLAGPLPACVLPPRREFVCPEESSRYSGALEQLVFNRMRREGKNDAKVVELGSGRGEPVIAAMLKSGFKGVVHGYEINAEAAATAKELIISPLRARMIEGPIPSKAAPARLLLAQMAGRSVACWRTIEVAA